MAYLNTVTQAYPVSEQDIRLAYPNTSFSTPFRAPEEYVVVFPAPAPTPPNPVIQFAREIAPVLTDKGHWEQAWEIADRFADYTDADDVLHTKAEQEAAAIAADTAGKQKSLYESIVIQTQNRLDAFAQTHQFDNIHTASSYRDSEIPRFHRDGAYCYAVRDQTWQTLYDILADVEAGTRPVPTSFADIEGELPDLVWPVA